MYVLRDDDTSDVIFRELVVVNVRDTKKIMQRKGLLNFTCL
jgi:hypothetical protein